MPWFDCEHHQTQETIIYEKLTVNSLVSPCLSHTILNNTEAGTSRHCNWPFFNVVEIEGQSSWTVYSETWYNMVEMYPS